MKAGRYFCLLVLAIWMGGNGVMAGIESANVTLDYVARKAEERARQPFHSPKADLPDVLKADQLDYDHYRQIHFRHDHDLWADARSPFRVEFFHPGYLYDSPVHIHEFVNGHVQTIRFVSDFFDYGNLHLKKQIPADTGYAGFRVLCKLNEPGKFDEMGAFLGASYFRLLGKGQFYGESARGLALDCGEDGRPEEFPIFTDWWLGKPEPQDQQIHLFAILDSISCAAAYEFRIRPGETTIAEIDAVVFFREPDKIHAADPQRKPLESIGLAPLTSMFWFGPASEQRFDDYRPAVHDSDGLLIRQGSGELLWRPLDNPPHLVHQRFVVTNLLGFGLLQRNRDFAAYQDGFNHYHEAPSVWVQPRGSWGEGEVHLVELKTHYEGLDNIVAFWNPKTKPAPLQPLRFAYSQYWTQEKDMALSTNQVLATRVGQMTGTNRRQFAVDFGGAKLLSQPEADPPVAAVSCTGRGKIIASQVLKVPGAWRVMIVLEPAPDNKSPIDLRCELQKDHQPITETWTYSWNPP